MCAAVHGPLQFAAHIRIADPRICEDDVRRDRRRPRVVQCVRVPARTRVQRPLVLAWDDKLEWLVRRDTDARPAAGQLMRAMWDGGVLAESDQTIVVEGNHYFPPESVRTPP